MEENITPKRHCSAIPSILVLPPSKEVVYRGFRKQGHKFSHINLALCSPINVFFWTGTYFQCIWISGTWFLEVLCYLPVHAKGGAITISALGEIVLLLEKRLTKAFGTRSTETHSSTAIVLIICS